MKQRPSRTCGFAAVCASAVRAGTIASRNGSAIVTPTPRMNVRRERCFLIQDAHLVSLPVTAVSFIWNGTLRTTPSTIDEKR